MQLSKSVERKAIAMNRGLRCLTVALALTLAGGSAGAQAALPGATAADIGAFTAYEAFAHDESTGEWSLTPNEAAAALDAIANDYVDGYNSSGTVFMCVTLAGNALEASARPELDIYMVGRTEIGASAASLILDGLRCDFEVTSEVVDLDGNRAELMRAPLDADGLAMLDALTRADEFSVVLHGPKRAYEKVIELDGKYSNAREEIQAASVDCIARALALWRELGDVESDALIARWERETGLRCAYVATEFEPELDISIDIKDDCGLIKAGDSSSNVRKLQQLLCDAGYMYVDPTSSFSSQTRAAVARAQRELGLVPTGSADALLISLLESGSAALIGSDAPATGAEEIIDAGTGEIAADAGATYEVAGAVRLRLDEYRFAARIAPSQGDGTTAIAVGDADNMFIVFEGELQSLAAAQTDLAWDYTAALTLDGRYSYECTLTCERDGGAAFGSALLPLGGGRFLAYAEVPAALAGHAGEWKLALTFGETTLTYVTQSD